MQNAKEMKFTESPPIDSETNDRQSKYQEQRKSVLLVNGFFLGLFLFFLFLFLLSVKPFWFNPLWTSDDALQQAFPFHEVNNPGIFKGDLVYELMIGYLTPIHYGITYIFTALTGDPILAGHWVMLVQLLIPAAFIYLAVQSRVGFAPALFALTWFIHTRSVIQRITGGLPRGWAAGIFAAYLYFVLKGNHKAILLTILVGCALHPPATFLIGVSYGILLLVRLFNRESRGEAVRKIFTLAILIPVYAVITFYVLHRPEEIGHMVSYEEAQAMPEFSRPDGRFPFVPLDEPWHEIKTFGFQAFGGRLYHPGKFWKENFPVMVIIILVALVAFGIRKKREIFPTGVFTFLGGALIVYFLSRLFAFKLYVPDRHLQFPLAIGSVVGFTIGIWQAAGIVWEGRSRVILFQGASLIMLTAFILQGAGFGLTGDANFNTYLNRRGHLWRWFQKYTAKNSLVAGYPTLIDPIQLLGMRRGYATTESAHPFYDKYYAEMNRRIDISLRAHYAKTASEFLELVEPEGIDYFVFKRAEFYPEALKAATFFAPFDKVIKELASSDPSAYFFKSLPKDLDKIRFPFVPFRDEQSVVVDVKKLREYVDGVLKQSKN